MVATRYFGRHGQPQRITVNQSGTAANDGWQTVATLPGSALAATPRRYAFWVTGRVSNRQVFGTLPANVTGRLQLTLEGAGVRSLVHRTEFAPDAPSPTWPALTFAFLVAFDPQHSEEWGASWPAGSDLNLEARLFWNQDVPAYSVNWDVSDVEFLWMDLEGIPPAEQSVYVQTGIYSHGLGNVAGNSGELLSPHGVAAVDENWLIFHCVSFLSGRPSNAGASQTSATFEFGASYISADPIQGGRVAMQSEWGGAGAVQPRQSIGCWCGVTGAQSGGTRFGLTASYDYRQSSGLYPTRRLRYVQVAVRLDNLPGLIVRRPGAPLIGFPVDYLPPFDPVNNLIATELGPQQLNWEPYLFLRFRPFAFVPLGLRGLAGRIDDDLGENYLEQVAFVQSQFTGGTAGNAQPTICATTSHGIGYGDDAYRYLARCVTPNIGAQPAILDFEMIVFHPIRDPDGQAPSFPTVGDPVAVVPASEGPSVDDLPLAPIEFDAAVQESPSDTLQRFLGSPGYARTWGVWLKVRRTFRVSWSPLSSSQRDDVAGFLIQGKLWKLTPPGSAAAIPVTTLTDVEVRQIGPQLFAVAAEVAELVWTD
jgi:hypothetical protein